MTHIRLTAIFFTSIFLVGINANIHKRSLVDFGRMTFAGTEKFPTNFNNYGNYCGLGGGGQPVDELDGCCKSHDECYNVVGKNICLVPEIVYGIPYSWKYSDDGVISCRKDGIASSILFMKECAFAVCECDRIAVECFRQKQGVFNGINKSPLPPALHNLGVKISKSIFFNI